MTPDVNSFIRKHTQRARAQGILPAVEGFITETGRFAYNETHARLFDVGRPIWKDEWGICLVVDACRVDQFNQVSRGYGWLERSPGVWSVGSASPEWYGNTFSAGVLPDERIGLVTANPFAIKPRERLPELLKDATPVHENVDYCDYVFEDSWGCEVNGGYLDVTHPAEVTDRAYEAWQGNDLDRLVVHYMQPHLPFRSNPEWFGKRDGLDTFGEPDVNGPYDSPGKEIWKQIRDGEREREDVWRAYCDNLQWVLDDIDRLRTSLDAQFLLTSDHGNGIGEWGVYSHPPGCYVPEVRKVPWVTFRGTGSDTFEPSNVAPRDRERCIEEQLKALGYG